MSVYASGFGVCSWILGGEGGSIAVQVGVNKGVTGSGLVCMRVVWMCVSMEVNMRLGVWMYGRNEIESGMRR